MKFKRKINRFDYDKILLFLLVSYRYLAKNEIVYTFSFVTC